MWVCLRVVCVWLVKTRGFCVRVCVCCECNWLMFSGSIEVWW